MKGGIVVFAGPSVTKFDKARFPDIEFRPPAARGDVLRAVWDGPRVICLIDGYFGDRPSTLHKELLEAMDSGVLVYGAASMGALRAAELDAYGMIGVGEIFRQYLSGARQSDADVAVAHGPETMDFQPLTVAQVDVEATIDALVSQNTFGMAYGCHLSAVSAEIFFAKRSWDEIGRAHASSKSESRELSLLLQNAHVERKRLDALDLLRLVSKMTYRERYPAKYPRFQLGTPAYLRVCKEVLETRDPSEPGPSI